MSVGTGYSESYTYDSSKRIQSVTRTIEGRSYTTSYQYNTANQITQMIYPVSGRTLNLAHDSVGRVSSMADQYRTYINNFGYNGAGQTTGFSLGNVASENYDYDTNRMQLITQRATQTGGAANGLMNLTYAYNASGGQMGSGSTAGNAGQLISISGTIGGVTDSAAYTYDNLGRLVTSNQTSNGSSAQRRFAYDRWGNRTGVWDATSGGNQIQSITLQQSGGAPTNRITSVTSGSTLNYSYDATGNVTNDGVHSYGYDSENRVVSVDGGSSGSYAYDQQNRRYKKTVGSTVTHYVWEGSQVIGEYDGATGGVQYNYVYSGSRLLSKIGFGVVNWFVNDRLSTRLTLDGSGNVIGRQGHLPFGEDFGESGTQEKHHFTSYERDGENATDYAANRQYAQTIGKFMRVDLIRGSIGNPQSLNRYSYNRNDSINRIDPSGLLSIPMFFCHGGSIGEDPNGEVTETCDIVWIDVGQAKGDRAVPDCSQMIAEFKEKIDKPFENFLQQFKDLADRAISANAEAANKILTQFADDVDAFLRDVTSRFNQGQLPTESQIEAAAIVSRSAGKQLGSLFSGRNARGASAGADLGLQALGDAAREFQKIQAQCKDEHLSEADRKAFNEISIKMTTWSLMYGNFYVGVQEGVKQ